MERGNVVSATGDAEYLKDETGNRRWMPAAPQRSLEDVRADVPEQEWFRYWQDWFVNHIGHPMEVVDAWQVRAMLAAAPAALPPLPTPLEIDWPELHSQALGCGVEDRGLHNRYECAEYGWQDGVDRAAERVPEEIFTADQMREYARAAVAASLAAPQPQPTSAGAMDAVAPLVDEWISSRGTSMTGDAYAAAVELAAHVKARVMAQPAVAMDEREADEPTTIYNPAYVREKFADYQRQIDGMKDEIQHLLSCARAASRQAIDTVDLRKFTTFMLGEPNGVARPQTTATVSDADIALIADKHIDQTAFAFTFTPEGLREFSRELLASRSTTAQQVCPICHGNSRPGDCSCPCQMG